MDEPIDALAEDDLAAEAADFLPDREAMSVVDPGALTGTPSDPVRGDEGVLYAYDPLAPGEG